MKKKNNFIRIIFVILGAAVLAFVYVFSGMQYGVKISCDDRKILDIEKMPAPLQASVQIPYCVVDYSVKYNHTEICSGKKTIYSYSTGYLDCRQLENYRHLEVSILTQFYSSDGKTYLSQDDVSKLVK